MKTKVTAINMIQLVKIHKNFKKDRDTSNGGGMR
jgi:hypothetical protein